MPPSRSLPRPTGWRAPHRGGAALTALVVVGGAVVALPTLLWSLGTVLSGRWAAAGAELAAGAFVVVLVVNFVVRRREATSPRTFVLVERNGGHALQIRYSRLRIALPRLGVVLIAAFLLSLGLAIAPSAMAAVVGALGLMVAVLLAIRVTHAGGAPALTLSPTTVTLRAGPMELVAAWDDIRRVAAWDFTTDRYGLAVVRRIDLVADRVKGPQPRRTAFTTLGPGPGGPSVPVRCELIDTDPVLLHHLLRFYLEHPLARPELGGSAVLARLRSVHFPDA